MDNISLHKRDEFSVGFALSYVSAMKSYQSKHFLFSQGKQERNLDP